MQHFDEQISLKLMELPYLEDFGKYYSFAFTTLKLQALRPNCTDIKYNKMNDNGTYMHPDFINNLQYIVAYMKTIQLGRVTARWTGTLTDDIQKTLSNPELPKPSSSFQSG